MNLAFADKCLVVFVESETVVGFHKLLEGNRRSLFFEMSAVS